MTEDSNFKLIGDERDIPMSLGLIIMVWNACELSCRDILKILSSKGSWEHQNAIEPLISELGSVGITQALNCYSHEFPEEEFALASGVSHAAKVIEISRVYRNYYVHHISGVTRYGIDFSPEMMNKNPAFHEAMTVGPFAKVYSKTAKGKVKFSMQFITSAELIDLNNYLASFYEYLNELSVSLIHYFREDLADGERAPPPELIPILAPLKKPDAWLDGRMHRPSLGPILPMLDDEDDEPVSA